MIFISDDFRVVSWDRDILPVRNTRVHLRFLLGFVFVNI